MRKREREREKERNREREKKRDGKTWIISVTEKCKTILISAFSALL